MLNVDNAFVGVLLSCNHSVTVSSVRYTKHCVDGQPSEHSFVADTRVVLFTLSRSTVATMPQPK